MANKKCDQIVALKTTHVPYKEIVKRLNACRKNGLECLESVSRVKYNLC